MITGPPPKFHEIRDILLRLSNHLTSYARRW